MKVALENKFYFGVLFSQHFLSFCTKQWIRTCQNCYNYQNTKGNFEELSCYTNIQFIYAKASVSAQASKNVYYDAVNKILQYLQMLKCKKL